MRIPRNLSGSGLVRALPRKLFEHARVVFIVTDTAEEYEGLKRARSEWGERSAGP
jgi:hypothetical protein